MPLRWARPNHSRQNPNHECHAPPTMADSARPSTLPGPNETKPILGRGLELVLGPFERDMAVL